MNERNNQFGPGDLSERKEESWSPDLDERDEEMEKIAKIKDQIARIKEDIKKAGLKEESSVRIGLEKNILKLEKKIEETQGRADFKELDHEEDSHMENLRNSSPDDMANA